MGRQLRPNLKPVLQVMDPRGRVLAYVKIGWNDLTKELVQNEARALRAWAEAPPRHLEVPRLIHEGEWHGAAITVLSPHPHRLLRRGSRNALPSAAVLGEVASLGGTERSSLHGSSYWRRLKARAEAIATGDASSDALRSILGRVEGATGAEELTFGSCHGDWAPWNMSTGRRSLYVWDWERSARPTPVGTDVLHFWFEVGFHKEGMDVAAASRSALARSLDVVRCSRDRRGVADRVAAALPDRTVLEDRGGARRGRARQSRSRTKVSSASSVKDDDGPDRRPWGRSKSREEGRPPLHGADGADEAAPRLPHHRHAARRDDLAVPVPGETPERASDGAQQGRPLLRHQLRQGPAVVPDAFPQQPRQGPPADARRWRARRHRGGKPVLLVPSARPAADRRAAARTAGSS